MICRLIANIRTEEPAGEDSMSITRIRVIFLEVITQHRVSLKLFYITAKITLAS